MGWRSYRSRACHGILWCGLAALLAWSLTANHVRVWAAPTNPTAAPQVSVTAKPADPSDNDLTFFVVSDTHYGLSPRGDVAIPKLVDEMNAMPGTPYPAKIGGKVGTPRGVIHIGDITNDGKTANWDKFAQDYGLNGTDGRLKFPVYETWGNHDGGDKQPVQMAIKERNKHRVGLTNVSENGMHYSWDWNNIHFVSLGISPGTTKHPYDPENSTAFAAQDLAKYVGKSGRPVILLHHFGFDKAHSWGWWPDDYKNAYHDLIKDYNVLGILHGHAHKSEIYKWEGIDIFHPPHFQGDPKKDEPVTHGFFIFHITADQLTVAERKLDETWGMTFSKPLKNAAGAAAP